MAFENMDVRKPPQTGGFFTASESQERQKNDISVAMRQQTPSAQQRPSMRQVSGDIMMAVNRVDIAHRYIGCSAD